MTDTAATVVEQFATTNRTEFKEQINNLWDEAEQVKNVMIAAVERGTVPPLTAYLTIGQLFGAHGQPEPADVLATRIDGQRLLAGARR